MAHFLWSAMHDNQDRSRKIGRQVRKKLGNGLDTPS
jgi:hypothetical protein